MTGSGLIVTLNKLLDDGYSTRLQAFLALRHLEFNLCAFFQGTEAAALNFGIMNEQIVATVPQNYPPACNDLSAGDGLYEPAYNDYLVADPAVITKSFLRQPDWRTPSGPLALRTIITRLPGSIIGPTMYSSVDF